MGIVEELQKLETREYIIYGISAAGVIGPGLLVLFQFKPELLEKLNLVVLAALSFAISFPFVFLNICFFILTQHHENGPRLDAAEGLTLASLVTVFVVYPLLLAANIFDLKPNTFFLVASLVEFLLLAVGIVVHGKNREPRESTL